MISAASEFTRGTVSTATNPHAELARWRGVTERVRAEEAELGLLERRGSLLLKAEVEAAQESMARQVADHMLNFASRVAPEIASALEIDERRLFTLIDRCMRRHLDEKSNPLRNTLAA